jgi:hypothetical protein
VNRDELRQQIEAKIGEYACTHEYVSAAPCAKCAAAADAALAEVWPELERLRSWAGLMETLDEHYPAEVFDGSSGDPGPRIVALTREVDRLREGRDLAIAHDRQPYPTQWAYDQAVAALEKHRQRADRAERERDELKAAVERWRGLAEAQQKTIREEVAARGRAEELLRTAMAIRMYGERAPGGNENWADWDRDAEQFLRSIDQPSAEKDEKDLSSGGSSP